MNSNILIFAPLAILLMLTAVSIGGLGTAVNQYGNSTDLSQNFYQYSQSAVTGEDQFGNALPLYTDGGAEVCYYNGTSIYGEVGQFISADSDGYPPPEAAWQNSTGYYHLFYNVEADDPVFYYDTVTGIASRPADRAGPHWEPLKSFNLSDSWGWLALVALITAIGALAGFKFLGSGESETSVSFILKGTFFITAWVTLSLVTYPLFLAGGILVFIFYFGLTLTYAVGIILSVGGSS